MKLTMWQVVVLVLLYKVDRWICRAASLESPGEKTVHSTTYKTAINRPIDQTGETQHTFHVRQAVFYLACVAWRFWLGVQSNKGVRGQRNREEIGAGAT